MLALSSFTFSGHPGFVGFGLSFIFSFVVGGVLLVFAVLGGPIYAALKRSSRHGQSCDHPELAVEADVLNNERAPLVPNKANIGRETPVVWTSIEV